MRTSYSKQICLAHTLFYVFIALKGTILYILIGPHPLEPHCKIVNLKFTGINVIFLFLLLISVCTRAVLTCTNNLCFKQKIRILKFHEFLTEKL